MLFFCLVFISWQIRKSNAASFRLTEPFCTETYVKQGCNILPTQVEKNASEIR